MNRLRFAALVFLAGAFVAMAAPLLFAGQQEKVRLTRKGDSNSFDFETQQIEGTIQLDGAYHGVARLVDKRTKRQLIYPKLSALNLYRLMSVGQVLGMPRSMERTTHAAADYAKVKWAGPAAKDEVVARRQVGEVTARYEVYEPNAIEVTLTVRSQRSLAGFEVFLPNYFDKALRPHIYLQPRGFGRPPTENEADLVVPTVNDVFRGTLLAFPRDDHAARLCLDGRWDRLTEVQVVPARHYARCLAFLTDPDKQVAVVLMAHPRHCYAISARYHADKDADRLTPYSAFDFALFGDDLLPGDERTVKVRLAVTALEGDMSKPLKLYQAYIKEIEQQLRHPPGNNVKGKPHGKQ